MNQQSRPVVDLAASCGCGSVAVRVTGEVRAMLLCSCEDCQKATGAGHSAIAIVDAAGVSITGETRSFDRTADSGATLTRAFCPVCGTRVFGVSSRWPDARILPVGLFGAETQWFAPTQLIFARSHRDWDIVDPALPRHETYREKREEH